MMRCKLLPTSALAILSLFAAHLLGCPPEEPPPPSELAIVGHWVYLDEQQLPDGELLTARTHLDFTEGGQVTIALDLDGMPTRTVDFGTWEVTGDQVRITASGGAEQHTRRVEIEGDEMRVYETEGPVLVFQRVEE